MSEDKENSPTSNLIKQSNDDNSATVSDICAINDPFICFC